MSYFVVSITMIPFRFDYSFSKSLINGHSMPTITLLDSGKKKHMNEVVMFKKVTATRKRNTRQIMSVNGSMYTTH